MGKAEMDHKKEVADDAKLQKKLARSFQLAMSSAAANRKRRAKAANDAEVAGKGLHKAKAVRDLFDSTSATGLKVGEKLQPRMKKEDNTWIKDAKQQQDMAKAAAAYGKAHANDKEKDLGESQHDMKDLFPDRKQPKYDETGMLIDQPPRTQLTPDDAMHAKHMQQMMLRATLRSQEAANKRFDSKSEELGESGSLSKLFTKHRAHGEHWGATQHGPVKTRQRTKSKTVVPKGGFIKRAVPGGKQALKLAARFLSKTKSHKSKAADKSKDPQDRRDVMKLMEAQGADKKTQKKSKVRKQKHMLNTEDTEQVKMQRDMAKRTEVNVQEKVQSWEQHGDKDKDISTLFSSRDKKKVKAKESKGIYQGYLNTGDQQQVAMQKAFTTAQLTRQSEGKDKTEKEATRSGVSELFHGKRVERVKPKRTSEAKKISREFEAQKKLQVSLLNHMKKQQEKVKAQEGQDEKVHGKNDMLSLFRARSKPPAGKSWAKHRAHIRRYRAERRQMDESAQLEKHSVHESSSVPAPKVQKQTEFEHAVAARETPQQEAMALEQEAVGRIQPAAASMKQKMAQKMKSHFVVLLQKNKLKFNRMMAEQGVKGADAFYKDMKSDLDTILTPDDSILKGVNKDSLLPKSRRRSPRLQRRFMLHTRPLQNLSRLHSQPRLLKMLRQSNPKLLQQWI